LADSDERRLSGFFSDFSAEVFSSASLSASFSASFVPSDSLFASSWDASSADSASAVEDGSSAACAMGWLAAQQAKANKLIDTKTLRRSRILADKLMFIVVLSN
jgi:hypothetical protein